MPIGHVSRIPPSDITPESVYLCRREILAAAGALAQPIVAAETTDTR